MEKRCGGLILPHVLAPDARPGAMAARPNNGNPFDLSKKTARGVAGGGADAGAAAEQRQTPMAVYTDEEIAALLVNFYAVKPEHWELIPRGSFIRYLDQDGRFRYGGFVSTNPHTRAATSARREQRGFLLRNTQWSSRGWGQKGVASGSDITWMATYDSLQKVWIRADAATATLVHMLGSLTTQFNSKIGTICDRLDTITARLDAIERRLKM